MPSETLFVLDDLKSKFHQFDQLATIAGALQTRLALINRENAEYAGTDDAIAKAYHGQIDQPTTDLATLVTAIQNLLQLTGSDGSEVAEGFKRAETDAGQTASGW